jgi:hypothetical protein
MKYPIDVELINRKLDYYNEVMTLHQEAVAYLKSFSWCKKINRSHLFTNMGTVFCIFLFDIDNSTSKDDNLLWVVVGDIPPMYLDTFGPRTTAEVVEDYVRLAEDWIGQVKTGGSLDKCYPFKANATVQMAELLERKISFMKNTLVANIDSIAIEGLNC